MIPNPSPASRLRELAQVFLKLGVIGFGGPAAHIALMEDELVRRREWLTREQFLDLIGAANLIPGPNSTEVAIHVGRVRAGLPGLIVAGVSFIAPAFFIVLGVAWLYQRAGTLPQAASLLRGVKPVVVAIVIQALFGLSHTAIKNVPLAVAAAAVFVASLFRWLDEVPLLMIVGIGAGVVAWARTRTQIRGARSTRLRLSIPTFPIPPWMMSATSATVAQSTAAAGVTLWPLFLVFAKAGALLFGSGYVLLAFLRADLVERLRWMTDAQLLDAIAVGQVTPGPVFTTATFIGYNLAGLAGAVVATVGIFLPAFVFVALSAPLLPAMRRSRVTGAILDGVNVASLALMAAVTVTLARDALISPITIAIAGISALLLVRYRLNATLLIAAGAIVGLLAT